MNSSLSGLVAMGHQLAFYGRAFGWSGRTLRRYRKEVLRLLSEVSLGSGALALIGGTVVVVGFLTAAAGVEVGLQGYTSLGNIGVSALSGFVAAYVNTREAAPAIAGIALTATVGAGFTAQLGAMRVSEEIDALETMAIPSIPYLVTTRIIAGVLAVMPLYAVAVVMSYASTRIVVTVVLRAVVGQLRALLHDVPDTHRHPVVVPQGGDHGARRDLDLLLLRLQRLGRSGREWARRSGVRCARR